MRQAAGNTFFSRDLFMDTGNRIIILDGEKKPEYAKTSNITPAKNILIIR